MTEPKKEVVPSSKSLDSYTYLALGDSYTIGEKVEALDNFPNQLAAILKAKGLTFYAPDIIAQTGWTTDELQAAIRQAKLRDRYDFVTLLIGVNNQYRGRTVDNYVPDFEALLMQAIEFAGGKRNHVIVMSIPDWGVTPFAEDRNRQQISNEIDEYNRANATIAAKLGVHYINITESTRLAANDPSLLASDSLHPSAKEYSKWASLAADIIVSALPR